MQKRPFVITVTSLSGGGKTTIVNALKKRLDNAAVIYFDDYGDDDVYLNCDINEWSKNGNDYNEWHVETVAADIERLLSEPHEYIILDYPFGNMNNCVGKIMI
jgi:uridine kinase